MPGRPIVRTAKSSCFGNISIRIGPAGVKLYFFDSVAIASLASGIACSRMTAASLGSKRKIRSPSVMVSNLSSVSSSVSELYVLLIEAIVLEGALEGTASAGLITGPQQVLAEVGMRLRIGIVEASPRRTSSTASSNR
jgi:uncharacterized membrane protein YraQ (UPF0718 family)